jgi:ligand-binding sensor domain-containing protein
MPAHPHRLTLAALAAVCLSITGCGGKATSGGESSDEAPPLKVLHTYEEHGEAPRGRYTSIYLAGDLLLAGTEDGLEVFRYEPANGFVSQAHHPLRASPVSPAVVQRIRPGDAGDVWVASSEGIARFQLGGEKGIEFKVQESSGPAKDAALFTGAVWLARSNGLEVYEPLIPKLSEMKIMLRDGSDTSTNTGTRQPLSMVSQGADDLWIGCQFGLLQVHKAKTTLDWSHKYGKWYLPQGDFVSEQEGNSPLPGNRIYNLRVSPDGSVLAVCTDGGLATFRPDDPKSWKVYQGIHREPRAQPGRGIYHEEVPGNIDMPSSDVMDVAFGEKRLFLGTNKGLVMVSREGPRARPARVVGLDDGLPSSHVTGVVLSADGKTLFVATQYGLAAFEVPPAS